MKLNNKVIRKCIEELNSKNYVNVFRDCNKKFVEHDDLEEIISKGKKIAKNVQSKKGNNFLLVGQVQSGKTLSYLSVIAHLLQNGTNLITVIPAMDNILMEQTFTRINNIFGKRTDIKVLNISGKKILDLSKDINEYIIKDKKKVIIISLKNSTRLQTLYKILRQLSKSEKIKKLNHVIFDDEGDQGSFDDVNEIEENPIYSLIHRCKNTIKDTSYVSITATPMAHIIVSNESKMKPDYVFVISPGKKYKGLKYFFNKNVNEIVETFPNTEADIINENGIRSEKLKISILDFLVSSCLFHYCAKEKNDNSLKQTRSMLVHTHRRIEEHMNISVNIENIISTIKNQIDDFAMHKKFIIKKLQKLNFKNINETYANFKELLLTHIDLTKVQIINSNQNKEEINKVLRNPDFDNYIYIGSNMLQRGVTIKNLLTTYFHYGSNLFYKVNADTTLQKARWFGYINNEINIDNENIDLTRLYLSERSMEYFVSLTKSMPKTMNKLQEYEIFEKNFKNFKRQISLSHQGMKATRNSVASNTHLKLVLEDKLFRSHNEIKDIFEHKFWSNANNYEINKKDTRFAKIAKQKYKYNELKKIFNVNIELFLKNSNYFNIPNIDEFIETIKDREFLVARMDTEKNNYRISNATSEPFRYDTGRTKNMIKEFYVGDKYWNKIEKYQENIIFHLYKIKLLKQNKFIYKMLISLPKNIKEEYESFVVAK